MKSLKERADVETLSWHSFAPTQVGAEFKGLGLELTRKHKHYFSAICRDFSTILLHFAERDHLPKTRQQGMQETTFWIYLPSFFIGVRPVSKPQTLRGVRILGRKASPVV